MSGSPQLSDRARAWALFCQLTEQMSRVHGLTIRPTSYLRTDEEQKKLYDQKLTTCDGTIRRSSHQNGRAMDFIIEDPVNGLAYPPEHPGYAIMAALWLSLDPRNVQGSQWPAMPNGQVDVWHCEYRP